MVARFLAAAFALGIMPVAAFAGECDYFVPGASQASISQIAGQAFVVSQRGSLPVVSGAQVAPGSCLVMQNASGVLDIAGRVLNVGSGQILVFSRREDGLCIARSEKGCPVRAAQMDQDQVVQEQVVQQRGQVAPGAAAGTAAATLSQVGPIALGVLGAAAIGIGVAVAVSGDDERSASP